MTKRELAQKRNYFKFVLAGLYKPIDFDCLTEEEKQQWQNLLNTRDDLIDFFEKNSRIKGLIVPEYRCWCGKPGRYLAPGDITFYTCKKHKEDDTV